MAQPLIIAAAQAIKDTIRYRVTIVTDNAGSRAELSDFNYIEMAEAVVAELQKARSNT